MPRFNKIYAGPATLNVVHVAEAIKDDATLPGTAVKLDANGAKFVVSGAASAAKLFLVQDNYLALMGVDDAWPAGDRIVGIEMHDGGLYNVRVPTGQNIQKGEPLTTDADGKFVVAAAGNRVILVADETYNNTTGADQLVRARIAQPGMTV